jgi:xylan 1,4-beta-xylosidase
MRTTLAVLAAAAAAACSQPAAAQDVTATADLSGTPTQLEFPMLDCVGSSHLEMGMWAVWREHLANVARDIGFKHIRGHGSLNDDLSTYLGGGANMYNLFDIWNYLRSINMRPIVELSFIPAELASEPNKTFMHYNAVISPPKSWPQWYDFIADLVSQTVQHYGIDEIRQWRFEVYNEYNCGFWSGNETQYFELYNTSAFAIKSVDPLIPVGGPASESQRFAFCRS